jgi:hypothetical protein
MFATDADLLRFEPALTRDVGWVGQRAARGVGDLDGTTLTMTELDVPFDEARVGAGHVAVVAGVPCEVLERLGPMSLRVSRLRHAPDAPEAPPPPAQAVPVEVPTFTPQIALAHRQVLAMLGIDPDGGEGLGADAITNPGALRVLEALGALHLVFAAASALAREDSPVSHRASAYRRLFGAERARAVARLDTDGDGRPDATRRPSVIHVVRI